MLTHPNIDPVAIDFGTWNLPFIGIIHPQIHWYGLMYLISFLVAYWLMRYRSIKTPLTRPIAPEQIGDLLFYGVLGVVIGGRVGYVMFYNFSTFIQDPMEIFRVWEGGMSFHGGFLGVLFSVWLYGRKIGATFFQMMDFIAPVVPVGLFFGRIGNFINGELWGRHTDLPWGMIFNSANDGLTRHPSMLYEAALEGLALFTILWLFSAKQRPRMAVSAIFSLGYGAFRFAVEFVREPDQHIGFLAFDWLTMGMLLSFPMILLGLFLLWKAYKTPQY